LQLRTETFNNRRDKFHLFVDGVKSQQQFNILTALSKFDEELRKQGVLDRTIIEIGTSSAGFSIILAEHEFGKNSKIFTFDVKDKGQRKVLSKYPNVKFHLENVFLTDTVKNIITSAENTVFVFCDGGNKKREFNTYADFLKCGDYIFSHDYVRDRATFLREYRGKIWNWHESDLAGITPGIKKNRLINVFPEVFEPVVWSSYQKPKICLYE
jgi:hypothetical protein